MSNRIVSNSTFAVNNSLEQVVEVSGDVNVTAASELDMNLTQVGGSAVALGSTTGASSIPVVIASDQGVLNQNVSQVGGTTFALGQGTKTASLPVTLASDEDTININIESVSQSSLDFGQELMTSSLPVVIASDQSAIDNNLAEVGGTALSLGQATKTGCIPVTLASDEDTLNIDLDSVNGSTLSLGSTTGANSIPVVIASDQATLPVSFTAASNSGSEGNLVNNASKSSGDFSDEVDVDGAKNITITGTTTDTSSNAIEIYTAHTTAGTKYKIAFDIYPDASGNFYENLDNVALNYLYLKFTNTTAATITATAISN